MFDFYQEIGARVFNAKEIQRKLTLRKFAKWFKDKKIEEYGQDNYGNIIDNLIQEYCNEIN